MIGTVLRRSDVSTLPGEPVPAGVVVIVAAREQAAFWVSVGFDESGPPRRSNAMADIDPATLPPGVVVTMIEPSGAFTAPAIGEDTAEDLVVCLADIGAGDDLSPPHQMWGCVDIPGAVVATGAIRLEVDQQVYLSTKG